MRGRRDVLVGHDDRLGPAEHLAELVAGAREQARPDHDLVAPRPQIDGKPRRPGHDEVPTGSTASASSTCATTALSGPLPLSTTRSASA